jgi:hypothetical protein
MKLLTLEKPTSTEVLPGIVELGSNIFTGKLIYNFRIRYL